MIHIDGQIAARRTAPLHVQLKLCRTPATEPERTDSVAFEGTVSRVFRGHDLVELGFSISFALYVVPAGGDPPTGPAFVFFSDLLEATHVEAYLIGAPPECEIAAYEFKFLSEGSAEPTMTVEQLEELRRRHW